jgi:DNA primase
MLDQVTKICQNLLTDFPYAEPVREYLDNRLDKNIQKEFEMGYFPSTDNLHLLVNILGEENLVKSGLFYYRSIEGEMALASVLENHNMVMPYKNAYGKTIALVGRTILGDNEFKTANISKYKNTSFKKKNHLFGLYRAKPAIVKENCVYVVEGQFDCIRAMSNGIENCVCLGSGNMAFNQFAMLMRYTDNIILLLDNDKAGIAGMDRIVSNYGKRANITKACLPDGYKDLDQFLESEGDRAKEFIRSLS